ncbi:ParB/RepB/Spo0J family partition protein [Streptomyces sp. C10-9-1]|uniref:ParB/RepB/Spo0J family partition protein n=1 Tax=Streptomyces sp. C10-9-1 TaxID=1859285 RepID=UPI00211194ED|nr:ParB/RepB/Spo0J family partition protein [Streptomyces sp. C10-9-1]MCQ6556600.1 ParB/RepB/Spo0J family partition protein [Streptomyces sp. C10-9-1]
MAGLAHDGSTMPAQDGPAGAGPRVISELDRSATAKVRIRSLRPADSPRLARKSEEHVRVLAASGAALPPILVHRQTMRVIDGTHRLHAAELRGEEEIAVRFFDGDAEDAFVLAVRANIAHGLPLSVGERAAAARRIMDTHPQWSDRAVAEAVGLAAKTVAAERRSSTGENPQSKARLGKDGRLRPLDGASGRLRAQELLRTGPDTPLRVIAQRAGISISTAWDVRARMQRGEDPVPPRQRKAMAAAGGRPPAGGTGAAPRSPRGAPRIPAAASARKPGADTLERLRKDPSLRLSTTGRDFLRWFESRLISPQEWRDFVDRVPLHQVGAVAETARKNAELWRQFADQVGARRPLDEERDHGG